MRQGSLQITQLFLSPVVVAGLRTLSRMPKSVRLLFATLFLICFESLAIHFSSLFPTLPLKGVKKMPCLLVHGILELSGPYVNILENTYVCNLIPFPL